MLRYAAWRLVSAVPTLFAVLTIVFFAIRLVPGDPAIAILGDQATAASIAALREKLGLDRPVLEQYFGYLLGAVQGDLGRSLVSSRSVLSEVWAVLPYTLDLTIGAIVIGVLIGVPVGVMSAVRRNAWLDYVTRIVSLLGLSFPGFFVAILLLLVFSIQLGWFPVISEGDLGDPLDRLRHLALPALSAGLVMAAFVTRATRSAMLETLGEDYVRTAIAKGMPRWIVVGRHAVRNALIPVVTVIGLYLGLLIGNSVLIEIVFNRPGLGKLIVGALTQRDYGLLQGLMVVYSFMVIMVNLLTDLTYGLMDPRVRLQ